MPNLIFLDIDGTLLDAAYHSNSTELRGEITKRQDAGDVFALNSNRSLEDLLPVTEQFGITGPVVGENGIFVYDIASKQTQYLLDDAALSALSQIKQSVQMALKAALQSAYPGKRVYWEDIDTVDALSGGKTAAYQDGAIVALNNKFRKYTVSTHLKQFQGGALVPLNEGGAKFAERLQAQFEAQGVQIHYSPTFSNLLMYPTQTSKRHAVEQLRATTYAGYTLYAIGDEMADYLMIQGLGTFLTVQNVVQLVKSKANTQAQGSYAQGVYELLNQLS